MYIRIAVIFGIIGTLLKSTPYVIIDQNWTMGAYTIGSSFLSIGYIFGFALLYTKARGKLLSYFEQVGRLSMTNYLMQSVICTTIFYGYGLGYFGSLGVFPAIVLSIAIFVIQIIASHFYLKLFKAGPFEKLMRIGTYLSWSRRLKMKKTKEERVA